MEHIDGLHLLTSTHKLDGLGDNGTDTQSGTTTGVTVKLGQYHAIEVETVVELLGSVHCVLTRHRVDNKQRLVGLYGFLQGSNLVHHLLVDSQTTSGIDDDNIIILGLGLADGIVGNLDYILVVGLRINGNTHALANHVQLLDGSRTVNVAGNEQRILMLTLLEHLSQLTAECGLTRTLQTRHQHDGRTAFQLQFYGLATHQFCQLVMDNLDHQLAGLDGCEHIHAHGLLLHCIREGLRNLVVHVGIQQGFTDVLQRLGHIDFGDFSFTFQYLERPFKSVT